MDFWNHEVTLRRVTFLAAVNLLVVVSLTSVFHRLRNGANVKQTFVAGETFYRVLRL